MTFAKSVYGRVALTFLGVLVLLGSFQVYATYRASMLFVRETDQTLNRTLASDLAGGFAPFMTDTLDLEGIAHEIHHLMVINPHVEIYFLDDTGAPIAYFPEYKVLERDRVDLEPIERFIESGEDVQLPFLGDDPLRAGGSKPFSAAAVSYGHDMSGYIYVILGGEKYDSAREMLSESAIVQMAIRSVALSFLVAAGLGLLLFARVTQRLRSLATVVSEFRRGDRHRRAQVRSQDEVDRLASAFNEMADTIDANLQRLEDTDRQRRELIANVSHDLRSPIAAVRGYLERVLIRDEDFTSEERRSHLTTALASVDRLSNLVGELFELSKLDAKQIVPQPEPFSIAELVQDVAVSFRPRAEEAGVTIRTEVGAGMPVVVADIALIERVVSNLIENAIRYTDAGGEIAVSIERADHDHVLVNVSDTGCGIPPEDVPHVFDRFYRVDKSRSRTSGGSGLGLAIAKKILDAHETVITVQSRLEVGTTFEFQLPVHRSA